MHLRPTTAYDYMHKLGRVEGDRREPGREIVAAGTGLGRGDVGRFVAGLFEDRAQAEKVIQALQEAGISHRAISLVAREQAAEEIARRDEEELPSAFRDLALSAAWDRVGWQNSALPPYRTRVAPDVKMVIVAAGPLALSLGGPQVGATGGGIVGAAANFGIPLEVAKRYEARIHEGAALVGVYYPEGDPEPARRVLEQFGAQELQVAFRQFD